MRFRVWLTQHLGAQATAEPAAGPRTGSGGGRICSLPGWAGYVPAVVQLGVLARADLGRLADLGRNSWRGSVRRAWGTEMARLADDLAGLAATPSGSPRCSATCSCRSSQRHWPAAPNSPPVRVPSAICEPSFPPRPAGPPGVLMSSERLTT
jgi:hypothetical protein